MKVTEAGKVRSVKIDTEAVLKEGRTYVPIRFIAEALGAVVDYSDIYHTVGIYLGELTAEEITTLRGYAYTQPEYAISYEEAKAMRAGSMFGFQVPGADPKNYDENGQAIKPRQKDRGDAR